MLHASSCRVPAGAVCRCRAGGRRIGRRNRRRRQADRQAGERRVCLSISQLECCTAAIHRGCWGHSGGGGGIHNKYARTRICKCKLPGASPPLPPGAHIDMLDLVLTSPAVCVRRQHWPRHCLRQDVPVRRAQRHRPGRQRYLEVDEPGGLEEKGSPCLLVQAPQCFGCYIQTVYRS